MKKSWLKKGLSILTVFMMLIGLMPQSTIKVYAASPVINKIEIVKTYKGGFETPTIFYLTLLGKDLDYVSVKMQNNEGELVNLYPNSPGNTSVQYTIDPSDMGSMFLINGVQYDIHENDMPEIRGVDPKLVKKGKKINIEGINFDKIDTTGDPKISVKYTNTLTHKDISEDLKNVIDGIADVTVDLGLGLQDIRVDKEYVKDSIDVSLSYRYTDAFRIYDDIAVNPDNITIFPNKGKIGTQVTINTTDTFNEDYSIFFMKDITDPFKYGYMGREYFKSVDAKTIKIKVPDMLDSGETYKVVLTNKISYTGSNNNEDLTRYVIKQKEIGNFVVVDAKIAPQIQFVQPSSGPDSGSYVNIIGKYLEELNIEGLTVSGSGNLEYDGVVVDDEKLKITYDADDIQYNKKDVNRIERKLLVTIGRNALFLQADIDKNEFNSGADGFDKLYVKTKPISADELKDPVKDVVIEITTTLELESGGKVVITETAVKEDAYTFEASFVEPEIEMVTPNKIQVVGDNPYSIKEDTVICIQGKNFKVYSYTDTTTGDPEVKVNYPIVVLGVNGTTVNDGEIYLKRQGSEDIVVDSVGDPIDGATFEVLDDLGNKVDGVAGNETGSIIVVKIPSGIQLKQGLIGVKSAVAIANPIKGTENNGPMVSENTEKTGITFVKTADSPEIIDVKPNIVTINGGEKIVVIGTNFQDGVKVFIDGKEVNGVIRDTDPITTEGTLTFNAPSGREGITILQVMNLDGGSDSAEFVYVKSSNQDPEINTIGPNKGSKGTLVVVKGTNFFRPDLTVADISGMGIYNLLGTRVLLDNKDVNTYNGNPEVPEKPISYTLPELNDEKLLQIKDNELNISKYYEYATVSETSSPDNIYSVTIDSDKNAVLSRNGTYYTISVDEDGNYTCIKDGSIDVSVTVNDNNITVDSVNLEVKFDYELLSIKKLENGSEKIQVADYYDSIFFYDSLHHKYLKMFVDQRGNIKISNGNDLEYNIKIDSDELVAIKNTTKYSYEISADRTQVVIDKDNTNVKLDIVTPYYVDANNIITGHRTRVINKNEIWFKVPALDIQKWYDVTVKNPDTKSDTKYDEDGFLYFKSPQSNPEIISIVPKQGTTEGGTPIKITGDQFQSTGSVYIGGIKVPDKDVTISNNMKELTVIVPKYPGNVDEDFITDRKTVPVVIVNEDGGKAVKDDGFTYIIANSTPRIDEIYPVEGSAAGGEIVDIFGYDFRFYEPYKGEIGESDFEFDDLDEDTHWDNMSTQAEVDSKYKKDLIHDKYDYYYDSPVLPTVYFGNLEAKIVVFNSATGYIQVIAPPYPKAGTVDICVINNDSGKSNTVSYTYRKSNPQISMITPNMGKKEGNETVDIIGSGFKKSLIEIFDVDENIIDKENIYLVKFGNISNKELAKDENNSGRIINGRAHVELKGGLTVDYVLDSATGNILLTPTIRVSDKNGDKTYKQTYIYNDETKFIDVAKLENTDGTSSNYVGYEYIKVEVDDGRVLVSRGYSKSSFLKYNDQIELKSPNYHTVETVEVVVENPDSVSNAVSYTYKNPISNPTITAITGVPFKDEGSRHIVQAPTTGGQPFNIMGTDFIKEGITVRIGGYPLKEEDFEYINENRILVKPHIMNPNLSTDLDYLIEVQNEDGARATTENINVYYRYLQISGDKPEITSIEPAKGSAAGGYTVTIKGKNFAEIVKVIFGSSADGSGAEVLERTINKLVVKVPPSDILGLVDVYIENVDYRTSSVKEDAFEYISYPTIDANSITPSEVFITGGQEVTIKGSQFMLDAEVYFGELACPKVIIVDANTIKAETPVATIKDLGYKDVKIVNKDGGIAVLENGIKYVLPRPSDPTGFVAIPGNERSVVLKWDETEEADKYKIYGKSKDSRDYCYIGETTKLEYYIKDLEPDTKYYFKLWSVNKYDESKGYAYANCTTKEEDEDDADDKYLDEVQEKTELSVSQNSIFIKLPEKYKQSEYIIDLRDDIYSKSKTVSISVPMKAISAGVGYVYVIKKDFKVYVPLVNLKVSAYKYLDKTKDTNIILNINQMESKEKSRITKGLTRKQKSVSDCYNVSIAIQESKNKNAFSLLEGITFSMLVDSTNVKKEKLSIMSFSEAENKLKPEVYTVSNTVDYIGQESMYNINIVMKEDKELIVIYNR